MGTAAPLVLGRTLADGDWFSAYKVPPGDVVAVAPADPAAPAGHAVVRVMSGGDRTLVLRVAEPASAIRARLAAMLVEAASSARQD